MTHTFENRQYMIFNCSELPAVDFSQVLETSENTIRKSIDESKTFVKWEGTTIPSSIANLTTKEGPYTYTEIMAILVGSAWSDPTPID